MTDTATKASIITEFTIEESANPMWEQWFKDNDLGVPLAFLYTKGMIDFKKLGVAVLEETWLNLCRVTLADPNGKYKVLADMLLQFDPNSPFLDEDQEDDEDEE